MSKSPLSDSSRSPRVPHWALCLLGIHNTRPHMAAGSGAAREGRLEQCRFWLRQDGLENFDGHYHSGKAVIDLMVRNQGRQVRVRPDMLNREESLVVPRVGDFKTRKVFPTKSVYKQQLQSTIGKQ